MSNISRCWAVTHTRDSNRGSVFRAVTRGAILMASGRVPNTLRIFMVFKWKILGLGLVLYLCIILWYKGLLFILMEP